MSEYVAVDSTKHRHCKWKAFPDYHFAEKEHLAPVVSHELHLVACHYPLAFLKTDDSFVPMVLQGIYPGQNLCVDSRGQWKLPYVPRFYECRPFRLARSQDGALVVCIDTDCLLEPDSDGNVLFADDGSPAVRVSEITQQLAQQEQGLQQASMLAAYLGTAGLLVPWDLKVAIEDKRELHVAGLYKINEEILHELPDNLVVDLNRNGALYMAHCQLISMQHVQTLGRLLLSTTPQKPSMLGALDQGGTISFGNL